MLTIADKIYEGRFTLWVYGTEQKKTQVYDFLEEFGDKIQSRLEILIRMIDSSPLTYSHEDNFKILEEKVWELKFVSQSIRLACVWDPKPKNLVIFYGCEKKKQKWTPSQMENMRDQLAKYMKDKKQVVKEGENGNS